MLPLHSPPLWRQIQRKNFTNIEKLLEFLQLPPELSAKVLKKNSFPLNLPLRLAEKIPKGTIDDPIFRQFVPLVEEEMTGSEGFSCDPLLENSFKKTPRLLHKYHGRVLLVTTGSCAMHCRYCFRRHFDYFPEPTFTEEYQLIADDPSVNEVILSGGDPLSLSDKTLRTLLENLSAIPHIKKIRFHTRFPIGIPERIDDEFIALLNSCRLRIWFVIHCNHPNELDEDVSNALERIQKSGIVILNQSVLLKGVNDTPETMAALCQLLVDKGIVPYYIHQLDKVEGAAHFEVPEREGLQLIEKLRRLLPGYAVPRYVREVGGDLHKTPLESS